jgi:hypothetical protein
VFGRPRRGCVGPIPIRSQSSSQSSKRQLREEIEEFGCTRHPRLVLFHKPIRRRSPFGLNVMPVWFRQPATRLGMGTIMVVLVWACVAPSPALGSCGDYVTMVRGHSTPAHTMPVSSAPELPSHPVKPFTVPCPCRTPLPSGDLPCPGPRCQAPVAPAPMTVPVPVQRCQDVAVAECASRPVPLPFAAAPAEPGCVPLACQLTSVFRPPRCMYSHHAV